MTKFRTKSEGDAFLRHEIASVSAYKANQASALEATRAELDTGKQTQNEIDTLIQSVHGKIEDGQQKAKEISENLAGLKEGFGRYDGQGKFCMILFRSSTNN